MVAVKITCVQTKVPSWAEWYVEALIVLFVKTTWKHIYYFVTISAKQLINLN